MERFGATVERFGATVERFGATVERFGAAVERFGAAVERFGAAVERFGAAVERFGAGAFTKRAAPPPAEPPVQAHEATANRSRSTPPLDAVYDSVAVTPCRRRSSRR
ncbi:hypothetical protein WMF20_23295 [Sorangium sp. So ce834]|uniref:hypothetical protein n=1 Tax=Sorangium sp. So ce834 TaxID=3133321 RepID=UPI003F63A23E